ncbi:cation/H(+) antiporter 20-like [Euphorbia lathyris]|uniref:cation/H(+) antiporter 20-like n=1 Tax=Euphorbia lathyris TaxID=212925 RepID=UPI003313166C
MGVVEVNLTTVKTTSDGVWEGENPLNYAFPLLLIQIVLVLFTTRFLAFLLKPLRQPRVIAEILGGILLGPSALGRNKEFLHLIFPSWSTPILESIASFGLLFFLFLVGLELDLVSIRQSGKKAFTIALAGISLPIVFGVGVSFILRKAIDGEEKVGYSQYLMFLIVALSITAFPVLARILAELKLLTTQMGQTAMAAAAINDVAAWIMLALAIALAGNGSGSGSKSPLISLWVLISGIGFVAFMLIIVQPMMKWVARKCSPEQDVVKEGYICLTLAGVMLAGLMTDILGIHAIFGAFVFGLTIPKGGEFAGRLIKRIEDFVSGLLLPLYFASSGLKTDVAKIQGAEAWGLLVLVISTASAGKILGTFAVAMMCMIPVRESLALGVLMNTKGLVELIVLIIGKEKKVLNDEMFAILVLMALFTTFMTTPIVMAIYKPSRRIFRVNLRPSSITGKSKETTRIIACINGPTNVPSLVNLIESITTTPNRSPLKLYAIRLVELTDRSSSILMVQRTRKNGFPFIKRFSRDHSSSDDQIAAAFEACNSQIKVRHSTSVSALSTMHEDICHLAEDKWVSMIVLMFQKQDNENGWRDVYQNVLDTSPCSVALLVDPGYMDQRCNHTTIRRVCVLFFGGPDDRQAMDVSGWMAENQGISITLVRFCKEGGLNCKSHSTHREDKEMDEAEIEEFRRKWNGMVEYVEKDVKNIKEEVVKIGEDMSFDLLIVGKRGNKVVEINHYPELGNIGGILVSSECNIKSSLLVIQHNKSSSGATLTTA